MSVCLLTVPVSNSVTRFVQKPEEELKVHRGANVTLECVTEGAPVPVVIWEKFGGELPQDRHQQILGMYSFPQQTRGIHSMLFQCWPSGFDAGPTLKQHWVNVS